MLPSKLTNIAIKMFRTELVKGSHMSTLEHRPERLDSVGVSLASNILTNRVLDGFMVGKDVIDQGIIGVDFGTGVGGAP